MDTTESDLKALRAIENELTRIETSFTSGALPDRSESAALLFRQAQLLVEKSKLFLAHRDSALGQDNAMKAGAILDGIAAFAELRVQRVELAARASSCVGLAQAQRDEWFAARYTLGKLLLEAERDGASRVPELLELQSAVALEDAERRRKYQEIIEEQANSRAELEPYWEGAELKLDRLMEEIAHRISEAKAILTRVPHPDRFETWLLERLGYFLAASPSKTPPGKESMPEDDALIKEAAQRGRQLQGAIWKSDEMYYAKNFQGNGREPVTDEMLRWSREQGMLGLPNPDDPTKFAYPKWQFAKEHMESIRATLSHLRHLPEWARWNFFHTSSPVLRGLTPLQALGLRSNGATIASEDQRLAELVVRSINTVTN